MAASAQSIPQFPLDNYELLDRYRRESGRVFLTGTQALVRLALMQRTLDTAAGLNTAGFISGYRGSPLGGVDLELWRAKSFLEESGIEFLPAVNEELAGTAILGTQQVETDPMRTVDGVFGIWYGKGPGVDRAGDALKHGNAYGSSPTGGVLIVAGDDHGCVSSSMPHQSDVAFLTFMMPNLNPASIAEYLEFGLYGIALSRYSGIWVGFKAISETVESAMSVELPQYPQYATPDFTPPATGLHYRWPDFPGPQIEERLEAKKAATLAFAAANPIDRKISTTRMRATASLRRAKRISISWKRCACWASIAPRPNALASMSTRWAWSGHLSHMGLSTSCRKSMKFSSSRKNAASLKASSRSISTTIPAANPNAWLARKTRMADH